MNNIIFSLFKFKNDTYPVRKTKMSPSPSFSKCNYKMQLRAASFLTKIPFNYKLIEIF